MHGMERERQFRVDLQGLVVLIESLIILSCLLQGIAELQMDNGRKGIQRQCRLQFADRLLVPRHKR